MSVILDALKKLDREKAYRGNETSNIAVEILKPDLPHPVKSIRLYFLIVVLIVVTTLAVTYAVMIEFGFLPRSSPSAPVNPLSVSQQIAPAPLESKLRVEQSTGSVSSSAESQEVIPAAISREPVRIRGKEDQMGPKVEASAEGKTSVETKALVEARPTAETKALVEARPTAETKTLVETKPTAETEIPAISLGEKKTVMPEKVEAVHGSARKPVETTTNVSPTTPPLLKLSAIVWYEDPSMRFAMINGIRATEGSEIEGVKVVEINPTSVRFLHNGGYFEISMTR